MIRRLGSWCWLLGFVAAAFVGSSPLGAAAQSDFWLGVRVPGLRAYRRDVEEARRLLGRNELAAAATIAARAAERLPNRPEAHIVGGQALVAAGRGSDATAAFRRAFDADRRAFDEPALAQLVATTAARGGDPALALATTERAVARMSPGTGRADLQRMLADLLMASAPDRLSTVLAHYRDAIRVMPRDPRIRCGFAVALARAGHEAELPNVLRGTRTLSDAQLEALALGDAERAARRAVRAMDPDGVPIPGSPSPAERWEEAARHGGPWADRDREIARTIAPRFTRTVAPTTSVLPTRRAPGRANARPASKRLRWSTETRP